MQRGNAGRLDQGAAFDLEALDDVELVHLCASHGHRRQAPTPRRGRAADAALSIKGAASFQDAVDRAFMRYAWRPSRHEFRSDDGCAVLA